MWRASGARPVITGARLGVEEIEPSLFRFIWKYSRRDQLVLLLVTLALFPLLYLTLELPKRIINDAIGSLSTTIDVLGHEIDQIAFLWLLCLAFLAAVLAHGLLKMRINTMKGVLSERMLRRFRYQLINRALRFPQPYFERVSQGELVSMITAESEPMGGLMGDALSQPVLQAGQMATILFFLFSQSLWFGLAAVALIPLQAWLIPRMQRQINALNKQRIREVRALAGEIGETAAGAGALRVNGGWRYRRALISRRLGQLFAIRFRIYRKKFLMKFLNNFITQLTPFFFYAVGGYLVLRGDVSLGALVAALAAYKDLSSPWKELLTYYNQTQDMAVRWDIIVERFAPPGMIDEALFEGDPDEVPRLTGDVAIDCVTVRDVDGNVVLEDLKATFPGGRFCAVAAPGEEDRRALAALLTREVLPVRGGVRIGALRLDGLHQKTIALRIGHATSKPALFGGSFGDNVMMPLRFRPVGPPADPAALAEAVRTGNSADPPDAEWTDPAIAGLEDREALRRWWLRLIAGVGPGTVLFRRGLEQSFEPGDHPELAACLVALRPKVRAAVEAADLAQYAHFFDPERYNPALPVAENLLFAVPRVEITQDLLARQPAFLAQLHRLGLDEGLVHLTRDVIDMLRRIFGRDGTDHPLFRRLGVDPATYEKVVDLVEKTRHAGAAALSDEELAYLLTVPIRISAEQIGPAFTEEMMARILELRRTHAAELLASLEGLFEPLDAGRFAPGLTVLENALFGKVSEVAGARADELRRLVADVLIANGARDLVTELIHDLPVAVGGQNLPATFAEPLAVCRAAIKRPDILILEGALASFDDETRATVFRNLRELLPEATLICIEPHIADPDEFDMFMEIERGRVVSEEVHLPTAEESAASADLARKVRALAEVPLFSGLDRRQLRLLGFGARWYHAKAGEVVFLKDDDPGDGAYVVIEGEAGLYLPHEDGEDELVARVGPGALVGELGLIRKEPRALSMIAETDLTCLRIGEEEFLAVVGTDAAVAYKLLQVVAGYVPR